MLQDIEMIFSHFITCLKYSKLFSDKNKNYFIFSCSLKVHGDHQYTVEDEKKIDEEIEELERKIKAVSSEKLQLFNYHPKLAFLFLP